jgi:hypothetical protein
MYEERRNYAFKALGEVIVLRRELMGAVSYFT